MEESKKVYGIDLGTTYSCIATIDEYGQPIVLKNSLGSDVTPSVVYYESENKVIVGETAKDEVDSSRVVSFIKREMGNDHFESKCIFPENPPTVSAYILGQLVKDANDATMDNIKDVVITCPAYFGLKERLQTEKAGEIAGLNVLSIINEPTAAAISYGLKTQEEKIILVYDLGGGTFDVTLIDVTNSKIKVAATGGDSRLGGADWDKEIVKYLAEQFEEETGVSDILSDPDTKLHLYIQAEKAKKQLSSKEIYKATVMHDGTAAKIEITREKFESLTSNLLGRTISIMRDVLEAAKEKDSKYAHFDEVLLVGGSCYMPQVKIAVDTALGCNAKLFDPNQAIAKGAAMYAMNEKEYEMEEELTDRPKPIDNDDNSTIIGVGGSKKKKEIVNVSSKTYGISSVIRKKDNTYEEVISNMIFEQDEVPISASSTFSSVEDGQSEMLLELFETSTTRNDSVTVEGKEYKGRIERKYGGDEALCGLTIDFGGSFPEGYPIDVTVTLNAKGIVVITAKDNRTGKEMFVEAKVKGILSDEEVKKAAAKFAQMEIDS
ncbi:MAG: Hsp70 family protein [Dysgonamonadaceae bacterium]|jgi:molecular chaperone DnaK (HSP70)|nr:Hsp70 family protein [Dysgonamonadaceae bacterium]